MKYPLYELTDEILERLINLGATVCSISKNYDEPNKNKVSSIHFFKDDKIIDGCLQEVAYFIPDLHSSRFGNMSGFNEVNRKNGLDLDNLIHFTIDELRESISVDYEFNDFDKKNVRKNKIK